jgi:hypothetical protein
VYDDRDETDENLVNFQSGTVTRIAGPERGVSFSEPVISANWIAWASWRQAGQGGAAASAAPLHWTISAVPTSDPTATPIEVARGTNVEAPFPAYPTVAIDDDVLAYTIESPQPGHPEANAIVVHDLSTGADVSQTQTDQSLYDLAVSGAAVLYTEGPLDEYGEWYDTRVMLAVNGGPSVRVAAHADDATLDGQRLAWTEDRLDLDGIYSLRTMTATVSNLEPVQLSRQSTQSQAYEGYLPAAGENLVSWWDRARSGEPGGHLMIWDPITGATVPIFDTGGMTFSGLCGAWVGWQTAVESPPGNALEAFYDAPLDAVKRLFQ